MRFLAVASILALATNPPQAFAADIPLVGIGLPYSPENPEPVAPEHPLHHKIEISEVEGLAATLKSSSLNWIAAAKRSSINKGLLETFERMNMLAGEPANARAKLAVSWGGSVAPSRTDSGYVTTVTFRYRLTRIDNGAVLFDREITTRSEGDGRGDLSMLQNGMVRAAIATNFAAAANCIDHAAFGVAPADCALVPLFKVTVVRQR